MVPDVEADRWERIKALFQVAFECDAAERPRWLDAACGGDVELRTAVEALLAAHASAGSFLTDAAEFADSSPRPSAPLTRIGPYRIIRELGHGGMGAVYLAERDDPGLRKTVAIKVVDRDSHFLLRRFRTETQILATLEHPGIARLYDGGTTDEGLPYFVMEYVAGENVLAYCDSHRLSIADRLRLFRRVCDAVQFAHQSLIVHRDLKPSNILVTADGEPKLLDFGIAKLLNPELAGEPSEETIEMARLLTPQYASPEHVRGLLITTASDVYSLGVILYELVSGARPYRISSEQSAEIERTICETDPSAPSSASPSRAKRELRGDVDNIILKALRKDARERYATAAELGEDIRRYLDGYPVLAQPDRVTYRVRKFARRHRAGVIAASAVLVAILGGTFSTIRQLRRAERRFADVRSLSHAVLFDVYDAIRPLPGSVAARRVVATHAKEYLDRLAAEAGNDSMLVRDLAESYLRLGDVRGRPYTANLGDTAGALDSYQKARALLEREAARHPNDPAVLQPLCEAYLAIGRALGREDKPEPSLEILTKAIRVAETLTAQHPSELRYREQLSRAYMDLGWPQSILALRAGTVAALETLRATYQRALDTQLAAGPQPEESWNFALSQKYFYLGYSLHFLGDRTGDSAYYAQALANDLTGSAVRRRVAAAHPEHDYRRDLADAATNVAWSRWKAEGDLDSVMRDFRDALATFQQLADADPNNLELRLDIAEAHLNIGRTLAEAGRREEAIASLRAALAEYEHAQHVDPNSRENAANLEKVRRQIASLQAR